ncbi:MAG: ABC transporter ATP-binding protein/permease [Lachnospiraceae bacterium]|nr:ABC transporter ATP-binding protein/permease [Lachnospiraceae bacterium]
MKKLLVYIKEYRLECVLGPLFKLLEAFFDLMVPLVMAAMIDKGILEHNKEIIFKYGLVTFLLALVGLISSVTAQYFAAKASIGFVRNIRNALFKHINKLSIGQIETIGKDSLVTRITSDINQVQSGTNMALRLFLRSPFIVVGAVAMSFTINVKIALILTAMIILLAVVIFGIMLITMPGFKKTQKQLEKIALHTGENVDGARVIRAFNHENKEEENFRKDNNLLKKLQLKVSSISTSMNPMTYLILNGFLVVILFVGTKNVGSGAMKVGQLIALTNYMTQILTELIKLADTIILTSKAVSSGDRINEIFEVKPDLLDGTVDLNETDKAGNIVEFNKVSYSYKGSKENALEKISFDAKKGETIGIIGRTGSGKSTLINLIPRFYDATEGEVKLFGKDVKSVTLESLRAKVGIVLQKSVLFKGSLRDNLLMANPDATEEEMIEALKLSQSYDFIMNGKDGLDTKVLINGNNFSGGQKQRLFIACTLVKKPEIIILDDSFSALDYLTDKNLRKDLKALPYNPLTIIVSQRITSVIDCDRIIVMDEGEMVGYDSHDNLLKNCLEYQDIYDSQQ